MEPDEETRAPEDQILEYAIEYQRSGTYPSELTKEKKRAVRKRAEKLIVENGEIYYIKNKRRVKVVTSAEEQAQILRDCHSNPTSGHFGIAKTQKMAAERSYWKGMANQVTEMVKNCHICQQKKNDLRTPVQPTGSQDCRGSAQEQNLMVITSYNREPIFSEEDMCFVQSVEVSGSTTLPVNITTYSTMPITSPTTVLVSPMVSTTSSFQPQLQTQQNIQQQQDASYQTEPASLEDLMYDSDDEAMPMDTMYSDATPTPHFNQCPTGTGGGSAGGGSQAESGSGGQSTLVTGYSSQNFGPSMVVRGNGGGGLGGSGGDDGSFNNNRHIWHDSEKLGCLDKPQKLSLQVAEIPSEIDNLPLDPTTTPEVNDMMAYYSQFESSGSSQQPMQESSVNSDTIPTGTPCQAPLPTSASPPMRANADLFDLRQYEDNGKMCLEMLVRGDLPEAERCFALDLLSKSVDFCKGLEDIMCDPCDLNISNHVCANICDFQSVFAESKLIFSIPSDCKHVNQWLTERGVAASFLDRYAILQQVLNTMATIHDCSRDTSFWGCFMVFVAPDVRVYISPDIVPILCKIHATVRDQCLKSHSEDINAVFDLYKRLFPHDMNRDNYWTSPIAKETLWLFYTKMSDTSSVPKMSEIARMMGERKMCTIEIYYYLLDITCYIFCVEGELVSKVLSPIKSMILPEMKIVWEHPGQPVDDQDKVIAVWPMRLRVLHT